VRLLAVALTAAAIVAAPAAAAPPSAETATPCTKAARGKPMLACLLDTAEKILGAEGAKDPEEAAALWVKLSEVSADMGDLARARRAADKIAGGGQRRLAEARVAVLMAKKGDAKGASAILDAMQKQPLPVGQVDWAAASIVAALNDPARAKAWLDSLPPDRRVDGLLALVREQQKAKRPQEAERLLKQFGEALGAKAPAETTAIIVHSPAAMAFIDAGRLDAARRMIALLPSLDTSRLEARLALKLDQTGKRAEAKKALEALAAQPRSSDARLARAVLAARHGDFAGARKWFPPSLSYDQALLDELFALLAKAVQGRQAVAMIDTMNNSKDKAATLAHLSIVSAKAGQKAEAEAYLRLTRKIMDPLVNLDHGAAQTLIDFGTALERTVGAMMALDLESDALHFIRKLEIAVQTDPYGLARPGVMAGLIGANKALYAAKLERKDAAGVRRLLARSWRVTAGVSAYLDAGLVTEAVFVAEKEAREGLAKADDFLAIAQYIAKH
jgi:tetratricopeptide (TPR) repeat protein